MRNGHREYYEVATADRARDGQLAIRADLERERNRRELQARFELEETRSLCRRALRQHEQDRCEQLLRESRALRAAAELRLEAPHTEMGQYLAAARQGRW